LLYIQRKLAATLFNTQDDIAAGFHHVGLAGAGPSRQRSADVADRSTTQGIADEITADLVDGHVSAIREFRVAAHDPIRTSPLASRSDNRLARCDRCQADVMQRRIAVDGVGRAP
jgi:hypothetical protein